MAYKKLHGKKWILSQKRKEYCYGVFSGHRRPRLTVGKRLFE
ncbi:hypothetical protein [Candidatus Nitrosocosmicus franklandus]|nr:hypothetical protein [Candidatus Nitrosocosmicus franklandus]